MRKVFFSFLLSFVFSTTNYANDSELPNAMAVLGDSISEGFLSDFSVERGIGFGKLWHILKLARMKDPDARFNAFREAFARKNHTWASSTDTSDLIVSHYERIKAHNPKLKAYNFAVSGDSSFELADQVTRLLVKQRTDNIWIDYVVMLIGANDLVDESLETMTSPQVFSQNLELNVRRILDANPLAKILIVGLPDIVNVFEETENIMAIDILWWEYTCRQVREMVYGPNILFNPENEEAYQKALRMFDEYHVKLDELVEKLSAEYPLAKIKTTGPMDQLQRSDKTISVDCFHPSEWGHAELAETTWKRGFWPNLGVGDIWKR